MNFEMAGKNIWMFINKLALDIKQFQLNETKYHLLSLKSFCCFKPS